MKKLTPEQRAYESYQKVAYPILVPMRTFMKWYKDFHANTEPEDEVECLVCRDKLMYTDNQIAQRKIEEYHNSCDPNYPEEYTIQECMNWLQEDK